jgi:hypothetical protein
MATMHTARPRRRSDPALLPSVVVRDELRTGTLSELCVVPGLRGENFCTNAVDRRLQGAR